MGISSTAAYLIGAGVAAAAAGGAAVQGHQQSVASKNARQGQKEAQADAKARALSQQRQNEQAQAAANRKTPDAGSLLQEEQAAALSGAGSTLLTGPAGVDPARLKLGRNTLLGG